MAYCSDVLKPWENCTIFKKNNIAAVSFELESKDINHIVSEEEAAIHEYRSRISQYESGLLNGKNWEYYKKIVNPYEIVYTQKKYDNFPESVCSLKPLSRSYFKMVEMIDIINFFNISRVESVRCAHVCEGPGGFIEALFDEAVKNRKRIHSSIAMTLKSRQTNVPGWRRASQFLHKNRNIKILYGEDNTGDIMKPINQQYFIDYCINPASEGKKIDIFTADGGFDFSYDYSKQEKMIFPLLLTSTKIGFEVMKVGGVFILKMFDFYEKATLDLLYLLSCHFTEWTLYKPAMSRPCNPEHYFIGKGYTGATDVMLDVFRIWCSMLENGQPVESLFNTAMPLDFNNIIGELRTFSFIRQTDYLKKVFFIINENSEEVITTYLKNNIKKSREWCTRFNVPISARHHLE